MGEGIEPEQAVMIGDFTREELDYLFIGTDKIRDKFKGDAVKICSIVNAKSGKCSEDCGFCSQSISFNTDSPEYGLMEVDEIVIHLAVRADADRDATETRVRENFKGRIEVSPNRVEFMPLEGMLAKIGMETEIKEKRFVDSRPTI